MKRRGFLFGLFAAPLVPVVPSAAADEASRLLDHLRKLSSTAWSPAERDAEQIGHLIKAFEGMPSEILLEEEVERSERLEEVQRLVRIISEVSSSADRVPGTSLQTQKCGSPVALRRASSVCDGRPS